MGSIIRLKSLTKKYKIGGEVITALNNVNLEIAQGEFICILGTSGSGKTTLLNITAGLERPTKGSVIINGVELSKVKEKDMAVFRRKYMGFIFQSYNLIPSLTALENATLPLIFSGVGIKERNKRAKELLVELGLGNRLFNKPTQMSGGQQQRVAIARALINNPEIIFADEPTGNLDSKTTNEIMELLIKLVKEKNRTLIMVTHDLELAQYADRVVHMVDGEVKKISVREETDYA
ncbi:MAG TPA: ABC transporter ATP-binding protein [Clostridia bacterium]|nr:ABC transporter ATP-binding protein [Clostridia bacterium]